MRINAYQLVLFFGLIMLAGCPETGADSPTSGVHGAEAEHTGEVAQAAVVPGQITEQGLAVSGELFIEMVDVPAGSVYYGTPDEECTKLSDDPIEYRLVELPAFRFSKYEITNGQYLAFMDSPEFAGMLAEVIPGLPETGQERIEDNYRALREECKADPALLELPYRVVWYEEAQIFVDWLAGKSGMTVRIPTAEEWEYVAEGRTEYGEVKLFPWGDEADFNEIDVEDIMLTNSGMNLGMDSFDGLAPGGSMPGDVSWCGAMDMAGNVDEITSTFEGEDCLKKGGSYQYGESFGKEYFNDFAAVAGTFFSCSAGLFAHPGYAGFRVLVEDVGSVEPE